MYADLVLVTVYQDDQKIGPVYPLVQQSVAPVQQSQGGSGELHLISGCSQGRDGPRDVLVLQQEVICVECRQGQHRDARVRERD